MIDDKEEIIKNPSVIVSQAPSMNNQNQIF
jgi:hypothetical protein